MTSRDVTAETAMGPARAHIVGAACAAAGALA